MHAVFVACLFGGGLATALFALLGRVGGQAHLHGPGAHAHVHGPAGHAHLPGTSGHALPGHGHTAGEGHPHASHATHPHGPQARGQPPAQPGLGAAHLHPGHHGTQPVAGSQSGHAWLSSSLGWAASWLSPLTLAAAAAWFGGVGLIAEGAGRTIAVLVAIVAAIMGAAIVRSVMAAFIRASSPPLQLTGEGAIATVNVTIKPDAPGEVIYTLEGLHRSAPARSEDGTTIPRGTTVVIVRRERGFAWVRSLDPLTELQSDVPLPLPEEQRPDKDALEQPHSEAVDSSG